MSSDVAWPIDAVVKLGGGLLADIGTFEKVLTVVAAAARSRRLLIVPGGGPFADAVRSVDRRIGLPGTAAHWMAVLAMDQHAYLIAARMAGAVVVADPHEIGEALETGQIPVLAPSHWLRDADPLPHSWDVTSDSIAAWVAGRACARRLVLIKPPGVERPEDAVDPCFARALPAGVVAAMVAADRIDAVQAALFGT